MAGIQRVANVGEMKLGAIDPAQAVSHHHKGGLAAVRCAYGVSLWLAIAALLAAAPIPADSQSSGCNLGAWVNGYQPGVKVVPRPDDNCNVDYSRPLFTREGALACDTRDHFSLAYNSMTHGWRYAPSAGVADVDGFLTGMPVTPEQLGCTIDHDGVPVHPLADGHGLYQTDRGWIDAAALRNQRTPRSAPPAAGPMRPAGR